MNNQCQTSDTFHYVPSTGKYLPCPGKYCHCRNDLSLPRRKRRLGPALKKEIQKLPSRHRELAKVEGLRRHDQQHCKEDQYMAQGRKFNERISNITGTHRDNDIRFSNAFNDMDFLKSRLREADNQISRLSADRDNERKPLSQIRDRHADEIYTLERRQTTIAHNMLAEEDEEIDDWRARRAPRAKSSRVKVSVEVGISGCVDEYFDDEYDADIDDDFFSAMKSTVFDYERPRPVIREVRRVEYSSTHVLRGSTRESEVKVRRSNVTFGGTLLQ